MPGAGRCSATTSAAMAAAKGRAAACAHDDDLLHDLAAVIDARARGAARAAGAAGPQHGRAGGGALRRRRRRPPAWARPVDALVLSSPALDPGMSIRQKLLLASLGRLAPNLAVGNGLKPEWISRDAQVVRNYVADPLVHDRVTPRLARFIVDGGAAVAERAAALDACRRCCSMPAATAAWPRPAAPASPRPRRRRVVAAHEFRAAVPRDLQRARAGRRVRRAARLARYTGTSPAQESAR